MSFTNEQQYFYNWLKTKAQAMTEQLTQLSYQDKLRSRISCLFPRFSQQYLAAKAEINCLFNMIVHDIDDGDFSKLVKRISLHGAEIQKHLSALEGHQAKTDISNTLYDIYLELNILKNSAHEINEAKLESPVVYTTVFFRNMIKNSGEAVEVFIPNLTLQAEIPLRAYEDYCAEMKVEPAARSTLNSQQMSSLLSILESHSILFLQVLIDEEEAKPSTTQLFSRGPKPC